VDDSITGTEKDDDTTASPPAEELSLLPNDLQDVDASESDVEVSVYRHRHGQSAERSSSSKARRSQSLDDVRIEDAVNEMVSDKIYGDDSSTNGNGDNSETFTAVSEEVEESLGNTDDDQQTAGMSENGSHNVRIIPVVRADSFKEAMRSSQLGVPDYSRTFSQPPPATSMVDFSRDSRSSWVMPVFPSLEEVFNEWFTSAMARTGSLGSSSGTPLGRSQSETSTSSGRGVQMRRPSHNSTGDQTSPLNTPEFHNKRLTRLFNFGPTHLGTISGSSDSLDSAETTDDWMNSRTEFSAASRLPPGFETGLFDRDFGFRPSLFSRMPHSLSDSRFSRHSFHPETLSASGMGLSDAGKVVRTHSDSRRLQSGSGSTSRVIPVKVITSQSSPSETVKVDSQSGAAGYKVTGDQRFVESKTTNVAEDECDSSSEHNTAPASKHSSHFTQSGSRLPAGFLTGFVPNVSDADVAWHSKSDGRSDANTRNVTVVSVSEKDEDCKVRVIPITQERNAASSKTQTRRQRNTKGRVIPVMVQSSHEGNAALANDDAHRSSNPTASRTVPVAIPVTVMQSDGKTAASTSNAENVSGSHRHTVSSGNYLPLCYDDDEGEQTVKKILQEMTIKRLPIRDTVRLLNMKSSRSMDFDDAKRHAIREESPISGDRTTSVNAPTANLLPTGFWVGNPSQSRPHDSSAQAASVSVTGDLIRKRLNLFDAGDSN